MNSFEQVIITGVVPRKRRTVKTVRRTVLAPNVVSTHVTQLEQRLGFGAAARYKTAIAQMMRTRNAARPLKQVSIYVAITGLVVAVSAWVAAAVFSTSASPMILSAHTTQSSELVVSEQAAQDLVSAFETTLADYHPDLVSETTLAGRAALINRYLHEWNSPLAEFSDIIAEQPHWKRVLAISFAESGLGKHCADNNCSGIGVEPGHRLWQTYETKGEWVKSMNRLLERRYKDWPLEKMNGVYNQPGSSNWIMAGNRILNELEARQIH